MKKEIKSKEGLMEKIFDPKVIEAGRKVKEKIKDTASLKPVCFHVTPEDYEIYIKNKKRYKDNGIKLSPDGGGHMIRMADMTANTLFPMAEDLGAKKIDFTEKRLKTFLHEFKKLDHAEIEKTMTVRDNAIKTEDEQIVFSVKKIGA